MSVRSYRQRHMRLVGQKARRQYVLTCYREDVSQQEQGSCKHEKSRGNFTQ